MVSSPGSLINCVTGHVLNLSHVRWKPKSCKMEIIVLSSSCGQMRECMHTERSTVVVIVVIEADCQCEIDSLRGRGQHGIRWARILLGELPMWKNGEITGWSGEIEQTDKPLICNEREKEELLGGCALDIGVIEEGSTRLSRSPVVKLGLQRTSVSSRNGLALVFLSLLVTGL